MQGRIEQPTTIAAVATAAGAAGIAVVRVSGPGAVAIVDACFSLPAKRVVPRRATLGGWSDPSSGELIDEVVLTYFEGPASYTGEDTAEISCHGSLYVQRRVLNACVAAGGRVARPGEFTERAFLNGRMDLTQAEGVGDLIAAESSAAHTLALRQMRGGISEAIGELRRELIDFAALIELENDFGEEDVEFADRTVLRQRVGDIRAEAERLRASFAQGRAIREGVNVVLAGRPNAGKSTLLNALLEEDRAIVSDIAGTTRDTIEAELDLRGVRFRLVDTAGIREAGDEIEALGVARTLAAVERAALLLYVWDVAQLAPEEVHADLVRLARPGLAVLGVANKMDLNPYTRAEHYGSELLPAGRYVPVVANKDMNLGLLKERMFELAVGELPPASSTVITQARHAGALDLAAGALERVGEGLAAGLGGDLIALELRQALHYLGEVTGEISTEDLLDSIFGNFCIGK